IAQGWAMDTGVDASDPDAGTRTPPRVPLAALARLLARIGITSFGGGLSAWMYREVVDRRRWLAEDAFLSGLTLGQILPGANVVNLSVYIGQRLRGWVGRVVALTAPLPPPAVAGLILGAV